MKLPENIFLFFEDGTEKEILTLNDLPPLTTGLLLVNYMKSYRYHKLYNDSPYDQTPEIEIVYLYFLKNISSFCKTISESAMKTPLEMFPYVKTVFARTAEETVQIETSKDAILQILDELNTDDREILQRVAKDTCALVDFFVLYFNAPLPLFIQEHEKEFLFKCGCGHLDGEDPKKKRRQYGRYLTHNYYCVTMVFLSLFFKQTF